jgi:hypothetical protein
MGRLEKNNMSKLALLSLFLVLSAYGQTRPTGYVVDPDELEVIEKEKIILVAVKQNMGMCSEDEVPLNSMKDLYSYMSNIQNKRAVKAVDESKDATETNNAQCGKPHFNIVSAQVSCLLSGVEESMYAFSKHKSSSQYLERTLGVSKKEATGILQFMEYMNEPGYTIIKEKKKKSELEKKFNKTDNNDGKI